jgi:hypothetical protein
MQKANPEKVKSYYEQGKRKKENNTNEIPF